MSFAEEWKKKNKRTVFAQDLKNDEVYEANPQSAIADIRSHFAESAEAAEVRLLQSDMEHPIYINGTEFWVE